MGQSINGRMFHCHVKKLPAGHLPVAGKSPYFRTYPVWFNQMDVSEKKTSKNLIIND
jgi:hypothetical protein